MFKGGRSRYVDGPDHWEDAYLTVPIFGAMTVGVGSGAGFATVVDPLIGVSVLLAPVNVALSFQRRFDWGSATSGSIDAAASEPTDDD